MSLSDSPASDAPFEYLELADFLLIAEAILGTPAEQLAQMPRLVALAESALGAPQARFDGTELHPGTIHKAAVLCERIIRNHPLPDGNKRCGFLCLIESLARNGYDWIGSPRDPGETDAIIRGVADSSLPLSELEAWAREGSVAAAFVTARGPAVLTADASTTRLSAWIHANDLIALCDIIRSRERQSEPAPLPADRGLLLWRWRDGLHRADSAQTLAASPPGCSAAT